MKVITVVYEHSLTIFHSKLVVNLYAKVYRVFS